MDKVKIYLAILKKHHFWVLSATAALFGFVCWWMGASRLAAETKTNLGKVDGAYKSLAGISGARPPNESFAAGVQQRHEELKKRVLAEWQQKYEQQQQLFHWPEKVAGIAGVKPEEEIRDELRRAYRLQVFPQALERVFEIADAKRPVDPKQARADAAADKPAAAGEGEERPAAPAATGGKMGLGGNPNEVPIEMTGIVAWNPAHQAELLERYDFEKRPIPSTKNVRMAQEDMWVLEALAGIIRQTNDGATDTLAAAVKRIDSLELAQWAVVAAKADAPVTSLAKEAAPAAEGGGMGMGGMGSGGASESAEGGAAATPEELERKQDDELLDGRYLNVEGEPLFAADPPPFNEFKRLFVRMKLVVDQRKIPLLLVNCANAPLPLEICRVRMDTPLMLAGGTSAAPVSGGGMRGGMGGMGGGLRAGGMGSLGGGPTPPPPPGGGMGALGGGMAGGGAALPTDGSAELGPYDVPVEICAVVNIYNPPDETKLGQGAGADSGKPLKGPPTGAVKLPRGMQSSGGMGGGMRTNRP